MDKAKSLNVVNALAPILVSIGAINMGIEGIMEENIIENVFGTVGSHTVTKIIYILIGIAALWNIGLIPKLIKK
jgi:uncharacterized membrane protein YuzA (DUF378 family)